MTSHVEMSNAELREQADFYIQEDLMDIPARKKEYNMRRLGLIAYELTERNLGDKEEA